MEEDGDEVGHLGDGRGSPIGGQELGEEVGGEVVL